MSSYETTKGFLGFRHTEWGPDAVQNFCNITDDRFHNFNLLFTYLILFIVVVGGGMIWFLK